MSEVEKFDPGALLRAGFDKALEIQYPLAVENVARLRRVHPDKSPEELITYMTKVYLTSVAGSGLGAGAVATAGNKRVRVAAAVADPVWFLEVSVLYTLSVAEVHGLDFEDVERRRLLVLSAFLGNRAATATLEPILGKTVPYWGRQIVNAIPMSAINKANKVLGTRFITKYGVVQGTLVLGKQIPRLIGAGVGASGNALFGFLVVKATRKLLGPAPAEWDGPEGLAASPGIVPT